MWTDPTQSPVLVSWMILVNVRMEGMKL